ncbi:MAG: DUF3857 domain-containing protein [Candidatus Polarisedimenticolia bacterium]
MQAMGCPPALVLLAVLALGTGSAWSDPGGKDELDPAHAALPDCPHDPGCPALVLLDDTLVTNESQRARVSKHRAVKLFTAAGVSRFADVTLFSLAGQDNIRNLRGSTILPDGRVIELSLDDVHVKTALKRGRTRVRMKSASFPKAVPGAIVEYSFDVLTEHAADYVGYQWDIQESVPVLMSRLELRPGKVPITWLQLGSEPIRIDHQHPYKHVHFFKATDVPALPAEPLGPPDDAWRARVHFHHSYARRSWTHSYGFALQKKLDAFMKKKTLVVARMQEPGMIGKTKMETVGAVYRLVQESILPDADEGSVESTGDDVLSRGRGSELERTMLFVALLTEAGIDSGVAAVASREQAPLDLSIPDFDQLDAFVAVVQEDGRFTFYDPATRYCPFGMVAPDKQSETPNALLVMQREGQLSMPIVVPVTPASRNVLTRDVTGRVEPDGSGRFEVKEEGEGLMDLELRTRYAGLDDAARLAALETSLKEAMPAARLESATFENMATSRGRPRVQYGFVVPGASSPAGGKIVIRSYPFVDSITRDLSTPGRRTPVRFDYPRKTVERLALAIPEEHAVHETPPPLVVRDGPLSLITACVQEEGQVICSRRTEIDAAGWPAQDYPRLKSFLDRIREADGQTLILERKGDNP